MRKKLIFSLSLVLLVVLVNRVAAVQEWDGGGDGTSWSDAGNWTTAVPCSNEDVDILPPPYQGPVIDENVECGRIHGPVWGEDENMVMEIQSGTVQVNGEWRFVDGRDCTGVPTLTISGGDTTVTGDFRWADSDDTYGIVNITGGSFTCASIKIGDDGAGELNINGGASVNVNGNVDLGGARNVPVDITLNLDGGSLIVTGALIASTQTGDTGTVIINLDVGTIDCGSFSHSAEYAMDINEGTLIINGDVRDDISADIYAGYITGYNDEGFVNVGLADGNTVVTAFPPDPNLASGPNPFNGAEDVDPNAVLSWTPGAFADLHDVYLGTNFDDVNDTNDPNVSPSRGRQDSNSYSPPGLLEFGATYHWRIDEVNGPSVWKGWVWMFTVEDGKASEPSPGNGVSCVPPDANLVWTPGVLATSHDVYFGADFNDVNDANTSWPVNISVYKGWQEANSYDPGPLELDTSYYWRIDEVGTSTLVKGDVWNFRTATINVIDHVIVYYEGGKFAGWPANNGLLWNWGDDEVVVGFVQADFCCKGGHNSCGQSYSVLARSLDSGMTWTMFDPPNYVGDGGSSGPSPGVNFAHPNFAMRVDEEEYYVSYDRCQSWAGPYDMGTFGEATVDSWENTSRTDYIANGPDDCLVFMSVKPVGGAFGTDRAFCVRTTDGGATFQFQGWIVPPADPYRGVMPSTVRCSPTKLVSALRRRNMSESCDAWVDVYVSNNNGVTWSFLSRVGETGCENGNPPALTRLSDGRLSCVYGNRSDMRMYMKYSDDEGASWGEQITLRDDWADCADDHQDLGYPRIAQLANGTIIAAYYWSTPDHIENHIAATIWDTREPPCVVDFRHFARFAEHWLETGTGLPADLYEDEDNIVNWLDLDIFVDEWLNYCPYNWPLR